MTLNVLSLFAGIGGLRPLELGLERAGMTTVGQVEIDPYCRRVLAKHWPHVPRHDDVRTAGDWWNSEPRPRVDVVCGGFPCQPISNSGLQLGVADERWGWPWFLGVLRVVRPRFVIVENVAALAVRGLNIVLGDLAALGFDAEWSTVSACSVGAPHMRRRLFVVAHTESDGLLGRGCAEQGSALLEPEGRDQEPRRHWSAESRPFGVAYGLAGRVDRLRGAGNAVVPQVAEYVGRLIVNHADAVAA